VQAKQWKKGGGKVGLWVFVTSSVCVCDSFNGSNLASFAQHCWLCLELLHKCCIIGYMKNSLDVCIGCAGAICYILRAWRFFFKQA
jgi:hypothetical protein